MKTRIRAAACVLLMAGCASAIMETAFQGVVDYVKAVMDLSFQDILVMAGEYITDNPDLADWPTMSAIHDSFTWIGGFFMVALTFQGIRFIMAADSPAGRANSKAAVQKLMVGMAVVSLNGSIFALGLDISKGLTDAFIEDAIYNTSTANLAALTNAVGIACITMPLALLGAAFLLLALVFRYMLLLIVWALFPIIMAMYFSQLSFLERIGGRGFNLFLAALLSNPVMAVIFRVSLDMFNAAADPATASFNVTDKVLAFFMSVAGFALAGLSPLMTLGLLEKIGTVAAMGGTVLGAATGGAAGAALGGLAGSLTTSAAGGIKDAAGNIAGQSQPNVKNDIKDAGKNADDCLKRRAVEVAAAKDYDATTTAGRVKFMRELYQPSDEELERQYRDMKENGLIREDDKGRVQVGDAGKELAKGTDMMGGYRELYASYGRGFGDAKSRKLAEEQGLMSDGRIVMKGAVTEAMTIAGQRYEVVVNEGKNGVFNAVIMGEKSSMMLTVDKAGGLSSKEEVIQSIREMSAEKNESPNKALKRLHQGKR